MCWWKVDDVDILVVSEVCDGSLDIVEWNGVDFVKILCNDDVGWSGCECCFVYGVEI